MGNQLLQKHCRLFATIAVTLFCLTGYSQVQNWFLSKVLNDNNGLPQNSVRNLYFDKQSGFLWMTTEAGLVRYDGVTTRVFDLRQLPPLKTVRMLRIFQTLKGETLVCNWSGEVFALKNNLPGNKIDYQIPYMNPFVYKTGNVQSALSIQNEETIFNEDENLHAVVINSLWLGQNELVAASANKIKYYKNKKLIAQWDFSFIDIPFLLERKGWIYAIEKNGRNFCFNKHTLQTAVLQGDDFFRGNFLLFYDEINYQPLMLKGNQLYELQFHGQQITSVLLAVLPRPPTDITAIITHPDKKTIFVATNTTGMHIYHHSPFFVYKAQNDEHLNNNYAACRIDSNYIFTCRSLLFNLHTGAFRRLPVKLNHDRSLITDTSQNIWSAIQGNIIHFSIQAPEKMKAFQLSPDNYLQTSYRDKKGTVWISTGRFLARVNNDQLTPQIIFGKEGDSLSFYYITENQQGQLIGINSSGIYEFNTSAKKLNPLIVSPALVQIRYIAIDDNSFCWITTYGHGNFLYHLPTKKLVKLPVDDKGYLLYSHAFIDDGKNNFLIPTNKGLFRISKGNLLQIYRQPLTPLYYQYFDVSDGLLTNEFNGGCQPAYNRLPNGDLLLPALQGLVRVKIQDLPLPQVYPLWVDNIETKDSSYQLKKDLHFHSGERLQTWQLSFAQWNRPNRQNIFYRLDKEAKWQQLPAGETKILLNDLTGGSHTLEIRYQYGLLPEQYSSFQYPFFIEKKIYEQAVFWIAVITLLLLLIFGYIRLRHAQLQQKNKRLQAIIQQNTKELSEKNADLEETLQDLNEALKGLKEASVFKNRLIGLLGHDMLIPIRFIGNIAGHLNQNAVTLAPQTLTDSSREIKNTAEQLLFLGENLIYWIKLQEGKFNLVIQTFNLHQLAEEISSGHKALMAAKNNEFINHIPPGLNCRHDAVLVQVILHNLLSNANKFTAGGVISINTGITETHLQLIVTDTGVGMATQVAASLNKLHAVNSSQGTEKERGWGMGYLLIIDLLRFAQGKLWVESKTGEGTKVSVSLPLA